ncbi:MAG: polysaccharide deacetylase family protein, partial [Acidobacteriota bacterium]|nr:polysaccharide deacetylase family protein [Acidobacteriota bacterium]
MLSPCASRAAALALALAALRIVAPLSTAPAQAQSASIARHRAARTANRVPSAAVRLATKPAPLTLRRHREVAVTFDDLPAPSDSVVCNDPVALQAMTARLLAALKRNRIPAIGFVNEDKLGRGDFEQRLGILKMWLDEGFALGNHTYSHADIDQMPLGAYEIDFLRGERVTEPLLRARKLRERYFRFPYLDVGASPGTKRAFQTFLARQRYSVAPVTIDNEEYMFAAVYAHAMADGDTSAADRVAASFVNYMNDIFAYFEKFSRETLGYEPRQVLLLHADQLDTDEMDALAEMMRSRGYRFISLRNALRDPAYHRPEAYDDSIDGGVSW